MAQDLQAIDQPRPRPAEVVRATDDVDAAGTNARQVLPAGIAAQNLHILKRSFDGEATASDAQDFRPPCHHLVPAERARRAAFPADSLDAAGQPNQLRTPMSAGERRVNPLQ